MNPKICTLIIKNFGCIGQDPVVIDIDDIVVLVGANNSGKSTILRAYEVVTGSKKLSIEDFPNEVVDSGACPEIQLVSICDADNKPGDEWCEKSKVGVYRVHEKWIWTSVNLAPIRYGYNFLIGRWANDDDDEKCPWGADNIALARRPRAHRVNTFDEPEVQSAAITSLVKSILETEIKKVVGRSEKTRYEELLDDLVELKEMAFLSQKVKISEMESEIGAILGGVFPETKLSITNQSNPESIKLDMIGDDISIRMGLEGENSLSLEKQGSGSRRTALWAILKYLADKGFKAKATGRTKQHEKLGPNSAHVLLLDEPEISLHPNAVMACRDALYSLPSDQCWQVMVSTHSPNFIDLTKDHTTVIRVEKSVSRGVRATTLFRPDEAQLSTDDKDNLKLMNLFDSHIAQAFFGGSVLVVEGDTEYSAFQYIVNTEKESGNGDYSDLNIIRARGKVTVASMMKVLNHFKRKYFVLHDTDVPKVMTKRKVYSDEDRALVGYREKEITNPAWTNNYKIFDQITDSSRVVGSITNFEDAYFDTVVGSNKPEVCMERIKNDRNSYMIVKKLLDGILLKPGSQLPRNAISWDSPHNQIQELYNELT